MCCNKNSTRFEYLDSICEGWPVGVVIRKNSLELFRQIDSLIFDLDGVIIDPTNSIQAAHPRAMKFWFERIAGFTNCESIVGDSEISSFKLAGGFNDDWNIASAAALFYCVKSVCLDVKDGRVLLSSPPTLSEAARGSSDYGGGLEGMNAWLIREFGQQAVRDAKDIWDNHQVMQVFMEIIAGPDCRQMYGFDSEYYKGNGIISKDSLLIDKELLLSQKFNIGVYTGRTFGEAKIGLKNIGLDGWPPDDRFFISVDDGMPKPDGRPLEILAERMGMNTGAFIGDNPDDLNSVLLYRQAGGKKILSIQVCFGTDAEKSKNIFVTLGADMIAPDANTALRALLLLTGGAV